MKSLILLHICCCFLLTVTYVTAGGTPCRTLPVDPDKCCQLPKHEKEGEVVVDCVKNFGEQTVRERGTKEANQRGCCIAECILNGTGHVDLSEEKMIEVDLAEVKELNIAEDWEPVIRATAKKCVDEAAKLADRFEEGFKLAPVDANDQVCHPKYVYALVCTTKEYIMNCPAKYYTDSKECNDLKEHFNTCEMY